MLTVCCAAGGVEWSDADQCVVRQVVWSDQWSTLLTFEDRRIIDDERVSVERPFTKDWNLHIRDVQHKDQGLYNCQINTNPVKIKTVHLTVQGNQ